MNFLVVVDLMNQTPTRIQNLINNFSNNHNVGLINQTPTINLNPINYFINNRKVGLMNQTPTKTNALQIIFLMK